MATIKEDYCSKEIYRLLIEKGFDGEVHTTFDEEGYTKPSITLQMAMKWLREVHDILIIINKDIHILEGFKGYFFVIQSAKGESYAPASVGTPTKVYEDAVEAAIKYCLEYLI